MSKDRAIIAGEKALYSLKEARDILSSASNWGLLDIYGGNCLTFQKIENAKRVIENAIYDMDLFLDDLRSQEEIEELDRIIEDISRALRDEKFQDRVRGIQEDISTAIKTIEDILFQIL